MSELRHTGLNGEQLEAIADELRNTHGMEGDIEEIVNVVAQHLQSVDKVCPECGGRQSACDVLGHRAMEDRAIEWRNPALATPAGHSADQPALRELTDDEIDGIANDGCRNAAGGIYATRVYEFARAILAAARKPE